MKAALDIQKAAYENEKRRVLEELEDLERSGCGRAALMIVRRGINTAVVMLAIPLATLALDDIVEHL